MYKAPTDNSLLGKEMVFVPECPSTMDLAAELARRPGAREGLVVITDHQTAGRGQRGNEWEAEPGMNLTFSMILFPSFLKPGEQFRLNMAIAVAVADFLEPLYPEQVSLKWPNDVILNDRKVCGILIQNHIAGHQLHESVVGIGLNVNQSEFAHPAATSLQVAAGRSFDLESVLQDLLRHLERRYEDLRAGKVESIQAAYLDNLYWRNEARTFRQGAHVFLGMITGIDENGRLEIKTSSGARSFDVKEVEFVS